MSIVYSVNHFLRNFHWLLCNEGKIKIHEAEEEVTVSSTSMNKIPLGLPADFLKHMDKWIKLVFIRRNEYLPISYQSTIGWQIKEDNIIHELKYMLIKIIKSLFTKYLLYWVLYSKREKYMKLPVYFSLMQFYRAGYFHYTWP